MRVTPPDTLNIYDTAAGLRCWCPVCEQQKRPGHVGVWQSREGELVCLYAVCVRCGEATAREPSASASMVMDVIERRLLAKYPALRLRLPPGYLPSVERQN